MPRHAASACRFILPLPCLRPHCLEANRACRRRFHACSGPNIAKVELISAVRIFPLEPAIPPETRKPRTAVGSPNVKHLGEASTGGLAAKRFVIEDIYPTVDGGRFPVKRIAGETIDVWADIFRDGHEVIAAALRWRAKGARSSQRVAMQLHGNDRWTASFTPPRPGLYVYVIEAWTDQFATWRRDFLLKREAGQAGTLEALEGAALLTAPTPSNPELEQVIARRRDEFVRTGDADALLSDDVAAAMADGEARNDLTQSA